MVLTTKEKPLFLFYFVIAAIFRFDHLVAIERSGRAADGNYYNMRGINIKHLVDPIDDLFVTASSIPGISTTGIETHKMSSDIVLHGKICRLSYKRTFISNVSLRFSLIVTVREEVDRYGWY